MTQRQRLAEDVLPEKAGDEPPKGDRLPRSDVVEIKHSSVKMLRLFGVPKPAGFPFVTVALLAVLGAAFACELMFPVRTGSGFLQVSPPTLVALGGVNRVLVLQQGEWFRVLSAVFLHGSGFHLWMNGFVLLIAGLILEGQVGRAWFLAIFMISGIGGSLMSITFNPATVSSVGASGAIMGLLAAAFVITFRQSPGAARGPERGRLLGLLIPALIPAASIEHIDVAAHLGGAIAGAMVGILIVAIWRRGLPLPRLRALAAAMVAANLLILPIGLTSGLAGAYFMRGAAAQSESDALANYDRAIAIQPTFLDAYNFRGILRFTQGQYDGAAADFRASVGFAPAWGYNILLLHLSRAHAGADDASEFSSNAARLDLRKWPGPILSLFLGKTPLAAIPGAVMAGDEHTRSNRSCEAFFYMGEYQELHDQIGYARELIRQAADTCPVDLIEHKLAKAELARLGSIGGQQDKAVTPPQTLPPAPAPAPVSLPAQPTRPAVSAAGSSVAELVDRARKATADKNYGEAMRWYRMAADQGDAAAQVNVGGLYANGWGVPQNYPEATQWFRKAAGQGNPAAQNDIGIFYANGRGVPQDYAEAMRWYRMAAAQTYAPAQDNIGSLYETGSGVSLDYAEAMRWFRMAAAQGYAVAQNKIGVLYERGRGVSRDPAEAVRWFQMAAVQGYAPAQGNVGWMIARGDGAPKDCTAARQWFEKAAAAGNEVARSQLSTGAKGACPW
jgi:TPR repeat protein/membrane associated rhomboid family serine protease/lipoprotein NlpI